MNEKTDGKEDKSLVPIKKLTLVRVFSFPVKILSKRKSLKNFRWKKPILYLIGTLIGVVLGIVIVVPMFVKPGETSPSPTNDILKDILVEPLHSVDSTNQIVRLTLRNLDSTSIWVYGIVGKNPAGGKVLFRRFHKLKSLGLIPPDSSVTIELEYWELEPMNIDSLYFYFKDLDGLIRGPKGVAMLPIS